MPTAPLLPRGATPRSSWQANSWLPVREPDWHYCGLCGFRIWLARRRGEMSADVIRRAAQWIGVEVRIALRGRSSIHGFRCHPDKGRGLRSHPSYTSKKGTPTPGTALSASPPPKATAGLVGASHPRWSPTRYEMQLQARQPTRKGNKAWRRHAYNIKELRDREIVAAARPADILWPSSLPRGHPCPSRIADRPARLRAGLGSSLTYYRKSTARGRERMRDSRMAGSGHQRQCSTAGRGWSVGALRRPLP